jgi:Mrp family chromosome partitioning ATPase
MTSGVDLLNGLAQIVGMKVLDIPAEIRECYEALRERLLLHPNDHTKAPYALAVIGYQRHEGVSTVAANLAATISIRGVNDRDLLSININGTRNILDVIKEYLSNDCPFQFNPFFNSGTI